MAIEAPVASATPRVGFVRAIAGSTRRQAVVALVLYAVLSLELLGVHALPHLGRVCVCGPGPDPATYMWYLAWWPHALLHGLNPFFTSGVFTPDRLDLGAVTLVPGAALLLAPVTLLFGPFVSYNLIALASPILAAWFSFLLCRYVTRSFTAGLVGGCLFGFSTYMFGHLLGHPNLVLTFPIPAAILLVLRRVDGRIGHRRFIALLALDLALLITFSTELALTLVIAGALTLALTFALVPDSRPRVSDAIRPSAAAVLIAAIITSPFIYYSLKGNIAGAFHGAGDWGAGDALGFLIPTRVTALGSGSFAILSPDFTQGNLAEGSTYLGIPLALIVGRYIVTRWRLPMTRVLCFVLVLISVLVLGSHLHVDGRSTIGLPWGVVSGLPLLKQALPVRLDVYVFLIAALLAAMWIAAPRAGAWGAAKWALIATSVAFLFPNVSAGLWHTRESNPRFFATTEYRHYIYRGEIVLALPWPDFTGFGMLWQAETGMWFRLTGGNLGKLFPANYIDDPVLPAFSQPAATNEATNLRLFLRRHRVAAVVVDASHPLQWSGVLAQLGLRPRQTGGVLLYEVPRSLSPVS